MCVATNAGAEPFYDIRAARASPSDRPPRPPQWSERAGPLIKALFSSVPAGRPALAPDHMSNPDDDTDVPSGFDEGAPMERTPSRSSERRIERL